MEWVLMIVAAVPVIGSAAKKTRKEDIASFCERKHADLFARRLLSRKVARFADEVETMASINLSACCRQVRAQDLDYYCVHLTEELHGLEGDSLAKRSVAKSFRCMLCCISQYAKQGLFRDDYETIRPVLSQARQACSAALGKETQCMFQCFPEREEEVRAWK